MKKLIYMIGLLALICQFPSQSLASSHREAPLISNDPLADNTDVYAFRSPSDTNNVVFIANYIPFEHPAGGPNWYNFGENIIGFKIFNNPNKMEYQDNDLPTLVRGRNADAPDAFISNYELRNLFFYQYLYKAGKIEKSAEVFLKEIYFTNITQFLMDVKSGIFPPLKTPPDFTAFISSKIVC